MPRPDLSTAHLLPPAAAGRPLEAALARVWPPVLAILLGLLVVGASGFSHLDVVHNASHDTRHSNAFPCH